MTVTKYFNHKENVSANMSLILQGTFVVKWSLTAIKDTNYPLVILNWKTGFK